MMALKKDISIQRQLLTSFRMRFSAEVQQTRENLLDSFIEHLLYNAESEIGLAVNEVQNDLHTSLKVNVTTLEIKGSLKRLIQNERVEPYEEILKGIKLIGKKKILYKLSDVNRKRTQKIEQASLHNFNLVCKRLFKEAGQGWEAYVDPFFKFLTLVFSRLAGDNYRMIRGELSYSELTASVAFNLALKSIKNSFKSLDIHLFESAAEDFFRSPDPEYAAIKWNMAQNYYALRVIGLGRGSLDLSREAFAGATFYMDTNVVISALEPKESYHKAFISLCNVCENLGIKVKVCKITLEELDRVIEANREMLGKVIEQIPAETTYKVSSGFFEAYITKSQAGETVDLDAIFENFQSAKDKLRDLYKVEMEDDSWFDQTKEEGKTSDFAEDIAARYIKMRKRKKGGPAAIHDAMCLLWVEELRHENNPNTWMITRDHTLPGCIPPDSRYQSLAITLDALIQWLSPIAGDTEERDIALAYSEIISSRILPQERIFNLEDFIIFHELEMQCKNLPPEDVEGCIRYLKQNMPLLNPTEPADREKLARGIAIYFADPSRKYKENVELYESEISKLKDEIDRHIKISLRKDALFKATHILILFIIMEVIIYILVARFGSGDNSLQRIINSWPLLTIPLPVCIIFGWFYLGKQKIRALGWPWTKIFKEE